MRKRTEGEEERIFDHVVLFENFLEDLKEKVPNGSE